MTLWCLKALLGFDHERGYLRKLLQVPQVALYRGSNTEPLGIVSQMLCFKGGALPVSTVLLLHELKREL